MRVLVCGSRHFKDKELLDQTLSEILEENIRRKEWIVIINGGARGADTLARDWAIEKDLFAETYIADWDKYGRAAGPIRNADMLRLGKPDLVVAFLLPGSKGTKNMIDLATKANIPIKEIICGY